MPPIQHPVMDNSTVLKLLQISQEATRECGQQYTIVTFDLAVAKKAYAITWQMHNQFNDVIVHLGVFHTIGAYLAALGKMLWGSGLAEVIIESGICAGGSLDQVMNGRHHNRAMRVHTLVLEALQRLLFDKFLQQLNDEDLVNDSKEELKELSNKPSPTQLNDVLGNSEFRCNSFPL